MVRLTFVETNVGTALHLRVERPIDDEECPFNPPDFAKGNSQIMLSRPRRHTMALAQSRSVMGSLRACSRPDPTGRYLTFWASRSLLDLLGQQVTT